MVEATQSPAQITYWLLQGQALFSIVAVLGLVCFAYIVARRLIPLLRAQKDSRFDQPLVRLGKVFKFWLGQWRHPRYKNAGILHLLIFSGFILLAMRAFTVLMVGIWPNFVIPGMSREAARLYEELTDYAATMVFLCMIFAIIRRLVFQPVRYAVPAKFGKTHTADAIFLLALIAILMLADSLFEGVKAAAQTQSGVEPAVLSLPWLFRMGLATAPLPTLGHIYFGAYLLHESVFYFLLCYRPFGIQFH